MDANETTTGGMENIRIRATLVPGLNRRIIARANGHEILMDIRKVRGGDDAGPTPPECLAMALGGCVMNLVRVICQKKQIALSDMGVTVEGDLNPAKAFGLETGTTGNRAGFTNMSVQVSLSPNLSDVDQEELLRELNDRCPLCDTIANPTPLKIGLTTPDDLYGRI